MNPESHLHPAYKPSAVEWLGDIPAHWDVRRAKYFYREVDETSVTGLEELMSVSHKTGVTPRKSTVTMFMAESNVDYKICRPGDVVINTMWAYMAALGVARQVGTVSPSYGVYRPRIHNSLNPDYVDSLLRTEIYRAEYLRRSTGITSSRLRLYPDQFLGIPLLCPPVAEQTAIVRYLDRADERIQRAISAKERLIELLNEQRQAVIHRAVTRGLDSNVPLKHSGVEWLGDVPAHWEVLALKRLAKFRSGAGFPVEDQGSLGHELPFFKVSDMNLIGNERIMKTWNNSVTNDIAERLGASVFRTGTIIFPKVGGALLTNKRRVVERPCCIDNNLMGCTVYRGDSRFALLLLENIDFGKIAKPGPVPAISESEVRDIRAVMPPIAEQTAIVRYLDRATADIDTAIDKAQRQIDLLREYRIRLIADVITGQVDVRGAIGDEVELPVS